MKTRPKTSPAPAAPKPAAITATSSTTVTVTLHGETKTLTKDDAVALRDALNAALGEKVQLTNPTGIFDLIRKRIEEECEEEPPTAPLRRPRPSHPWNEPFRDYPGWKGIPPVTCLVRHHE